MAPFTTTINNKSQSSAACGIYAKLPGVMPTVTHNPDHQSGCRAIIELKQVEVIKNIFNL
ncbi:unnamed protein product [Fusarium graminearum]|uniref:Chromosome 2, complete genome n=1 Tax=Gibberella zeae (strain ATCC MYA-4620 / CBS 123657 / FGSC 9075 / NRRL 31084 / PH-1) TaxID=229533 RepID=A0A098DC12_GIBZE|nr:unnamed protein product [Fusarium graminearum]CZS79787.1 unnamed protein product [Fusarium graminearum]